MTTEGQPGATRVRSDPVVTPAPQLPLADVAAAVGDAQVRGDGVRVADASFDTREVAPGSLFFCIRGATIDAHDLAAEAVRAGVAALVVERWLDVPVPQVLVGSVRAAMGPMSAVLFGRPRRP